MKIEEFKSALYFCNSIVNQNITTYRNLFTTLNKFKELYKEEKSNLPYHINLIDELHADENAHSRILAKLLRYKEDNKYPFLKSFFTNLCGLDLIIEKPRVEKVDSCGRIDIPIFDEKYVVVIENKVTDKATDQNTDKGGQLARYIETIHENFKKPFESIYVVYTPKYTREPMSECWVNKENHSYQSEFSSRYFSMSYRDKIYPWLRDEILPNIADKDLYLQSAVQQYIDYLEGIFKLRKIDKNMNMKLQKFIKEELGIDDNDPENGVEILSEKEQELNNALTQILELKNKYKIQIVKKSFENWKTLLSNNYPEREVVGDTFKIDKDYINIGVKFLLDKLDYVALIEWKKSTNKIYVGIGRHYSSQSKHMISEDLQKILNNQQLVKPDDFWYGWKYTSFENAFNRLEALIKSIQL